MFKCWVKMSASVTIFVLVAPLGLLAQSIPSTTRTAWDSVWEPPVRLAPNVTAASSVGKHPPMMQVQYLAPTDHVALPEGGEWPDSGQEAVGPSERHGSLEGQAPVQIWHSPGSMVADPAPPRHSHSILRAPRMEYAGGHQHSQTQGPHVQGPHAQGPHAQGPHAQGPHAQGPHAQGPPVPGQHLLGKPQGSLHPVIPSTIHPLPRFLDHHATRVPTAVIPDASHHEVWKSPYSYGFFGASGSRQWTRHFGYRDRDKEWRLR